MLPGKAVIQLNRTEIGKQRDIPGNFTQLREICQSGTGEINTLRPDGKRQIQRRSRFNQVSVDPFPEFRTAGHGGDQQRGGDLFVQKYGLNGETGKIRFRQCIVDQAIAFKTVCNTGPDIFPQADFNVTVFPCCNRH